MSLKSLEKKQIIVLHNCEIDNNQKHDLVITSHTQTVGYIRTKRQIIKRKISILDALYKFKESVNKNCPIHNQLYFSDSETTSNSSKRGKRRIKKIYKHKPVHLYNWNRPIRHTDNYILTVIKGKNEQHSW